MTSLRLRYQTLEVGDTDIHLCTLRDKQQFHDPHGRAEALGISSATWSLFGVVWPSGMALARVMDSYDTGSKRILEVGCGIALPSLLLNSKLADITATDYHPEAGSFLARNAAINEGMPIAFERTGWEDTSDQLGRFDLIIGSDLLYEDQHIQLLADFIERHARPTCEVVIVDPGRGRKSKLISAMKRQGYESSYLALPIADEDGPAFKGHILKFERRAVVLA